MGMLARREHSRAELEAKLRARAYPGDMIATTLDALEQAGLLANDRFAQSLVRQRASRGQGPVRIRLELQRKGVDAAAVEEALDAAARDWSESAQATRRKRFGAARPTAAAERARQARFLQYRGFTTEQIKAALDMEPDSD
jgi:regulatory protein